ncbi:hypothetical protein GA0070624_5117 [Micromonospora rhizosphaerae]|uniref:Uncharacterized protein n=1 Tax=Micromonospora rhizosphaerae TaxID=568872 RepID=A0A1C6T061_9ACTN|nr:hypothetical protein [Micromonospora rhizosphaerae]SCL34913.1 hypothetical protein GA0070624_5117 [Micromonospora rhizosphaerae]
MAVRIRSLAVAGPLYVPLTSGRSVRLSPGGSTGDLDDVEIAGNAKVDRLRERGLIDVEQISEDQPRERPEEDQAEAKKQTPRRTAREQK